MGKIPILTNIFQRGWFNHQAIMNWLNRISTRIKNSTRFSFPPLRSLPFHSSVPLYIQWPWPCLGKGGILANCTVEAFKWPNKSKRRLNRRCSDNIFCTDWKSLVQTSHHQKSEITSVFISQILCKASPPPTVSELQACHGIMMVHSTPLKLILRTVARCWAMVWPRDSWRWLLAFRGSASKKSLVCFAFFSIVQKSCKIWAYICIYYKPIGSMYGVYPYIYHKNQPFM